MARVGRVVVGRMDVSFSTSSPLMLLLLLLLLLLPPHVLPTAFSGMCPCDKLVTRNATVLEEHLMTTTTRVQKLNCCARHLLAHHDPKYQHNDSFTIVWSFKGKEYDGLLKKWSRRDSTFRVYQCGLETLKSRGLLLSDKGTYSCLVTSSSGASVTKTFTLCLNVNENLGQPPLNSSISENTLALLRQTVTFKCSAYVGEPRCGRTGEYRLAWTKERHDGSWVEADKLSQTDIIPSGVENGVMKSQVTLHSIKTEHFGRYRCTVTNHNGNLTQDVTLQKGVSSIIRIAGEYRTALVIMVSATMFLLVAALFWRRCQVAYSLHFRPKKTGLSAEHYQYDLFLVHGESASHWVWSILLPALEDSFGYTCFLPQRDMCGGSMIIEEVADTVYGCRCVVVVISPCLLDNPWAAWALHNAMQAGLQARTRLLALLLQDLEPKKGPPNTSGIISVLKHIRKITVPRSCKLKVTKPKEEPHLKAPPKEETQIHHNNNSLKTLKVDITLCRSRSSSPNNQKLSNMITGGNVTLSATEDKKVHKSRGPVIFLERQDSEEPGSPCSETPFILPSRAVLKDDPSVVESKKKPLLSTFLSVLCTGDQQQVFWHTVLGWLGPPGTTTTPLQHDTTTKYPP